VGGSVAEWLACWTQAQKARVQIAAATLSSNSLRQTVHTHRSSVHQAAKLVVALLRVAGLTAGLAESNGNRVWATFTFLDTYKELRERLGTDDIGLTLVQQQNIQRLTAMLWASCEKKTMIG